MAEVQQAAAMPVQSDPVEPMPAGVTPLEMTQAAAVPSDGLALGSPALASAPAAAEPPAVRDLLRQGALRAARDLAENDDDTGLVSEIEAGEAVLGGLGVAGGEDGVVSGVVSGVMLAVRAGARQLVIVFGDDKGGFTVPDATVRNDRVHLLFLADPRKCLGLLGVPRLGGTYDDCLLTLVHVARALEARQVFCMGAGAGAYSALRYGLDLGADGVLALGGFSKLVDGQPAIGSRKGPQVARVLRVAGELGADLDAAFAKAAERPGLVLCRRDPKNAKPPSGLEALAGATIVHMSAGTPETLAWADERGTLRKLLTQLLACRSSGQAGG